MALRINSKVGFIIILIIAGNQSTILVSSSSIEDNEVDPIDEVIPFPLRNILTEEVLSYDIPADIEDNFIYYLSGFDYENRPIWIVEAGKWDIRRVLEEHKEKDLDRFVRQFLYRTMNNSQRAHSGEARVGQGVVLVDMEGFSLKQITSLPTVEYSLELYRKYLPVAAKVHSAYVVNTNYVAAASLNLVKPILGKEFAKVTVYGTRKAKWIPQLLKVMPRDQLPPWYGGVKDFLPYQVYG